MHLYNVERDSFSHFSARLNVIRRLIADDADFLHHVTQLDLRDNKLGELDTTIFNNVEILHCERNQLVTLKLSGYLLKALYATSNGMFTLKADFFLRGVCQLFLQRSRACCIEFWVHLEQGH